MRVLVDTLIWSLAFRRRPADLSTADATLRQQLQGLFADGRASMIGPVRQELLSGIRDEQQFDRLRTYLRAFDEPRVEVYDYEEAAQMHNRCRTRGIAGSPIDFLICAVAQRRDWSVFTVDPDFERYEKVLGLKLHSAG